MARPERNNVDYFPFLCEEGKKMFYLEETYGNDGFAVFVKLLRELAKTNYHYLDLSKNTTLMFLSAKCKVSKETLLAIINDLVELEKFDKILWKENSIIWCNDFIDSIQDAYNRRNNDCITYKGLLQHLISLGVRKPIKCKVKGDINTQSKVEYNKVNNNIIDFDTFWDLYDYKKGKDKSEAKWDKLSNTDREKIIAYLPRYKLSTPDKEFRKHPVTFLNNHSWNDEIIQHKINGNGELLKDKYYDKSIHANLKKY